MWHCRPVKEKAKELNICLDISPQDLPKCFQIGIPPSMSIKQSTTFWGTSAKDLHTTSDEQRKKMGVPGRSRIQQAIAEGKDIEAR